MQFIKQTLVIVFIIGLGYGLYYMAKTNAPRTGKYTPDKNGTLTIEGIVTDNDTGCTGELGKAKCYLSVKAERGEVYVTYDTSDVSFCSNEAAKASGRVMTAGSRVRAFGFYEFKEGRDWIRTCPSNSYYVVAR